MKSARQVAFEALLKIHRDGAYSNLVVDSLLKENKDLDERDKAFVCNALCRLTIVHRSMPTIAASIKHSPATTAMSTDVAAESE